MKKFTNKSYLRIALYYAIFGLLWIVLTDHLLFILVPNMEQMAQWQSLKGWFFVAASTLFIFLLLAAADRKHQGTQDALTKSERMYRQLFENNPLPMWVYDLETLAFLAVNEAATDKYGYAADEFLAMGIRDIRPPEDIPQLLANIAQTRRRLDFSGEWRHRRKDGTVFPVEITSHELVHNGRSARLVVAKDLTERKQAQAAAREKTEILEKIFDNVPAMLAFIDQNGRIILANREYEQTMGWSLAELQNHPDILSELYPDPDYRTAVMEIIYRGEGVFEEFRIRIRSGQFIDASFANVLLSDGTSIGIGRDITHSKKIENALKESEARFRRLAENAQDLIYRFRLLPEPGFEYVSPAATTITGFTPQDHYNDPQLGYKLVHPDDRYLLTAVSQGKMPIDQPLVLRWVRKDKSIIWTEQRNVPIFNEAGEMIALEGIARDVTEQMRTQQALRESERRFRTAIEEAPFPTIIHAEDGELLIVNRIWTEITGYQLDEIRTVADWTERAYGVRQEQIQAGINQLYEMDQRVEEGEFHITCKDGSQRIWEFSSTPLGPLPDGRRIVISVAVDVTKRKQTEQQLRLQSAALEAAANGIVITDIDGNIEWVNSAFTELTDYTLAEALGKNPRQLVKSGNHKTAFYDEMWRTILDGRTWRGEIVNRRKDGTLYIEEEAITPVWDDHGNIAHFIAIKQDITQRKTAETEHKALLEQVKAQAERLSQVMRTVPEGVLLLNQSNQIILANPQGQEHLALLAKVDPGNRITHLGDITLETLQTSPPTGQWHELTANGNIFQVVTRPVETGPVPQGWVLVLRDVTEQQEVQKQLQQQERLAAVGQLAAGIAHDFNNIMAVIILYAQILEKAPELSAKQQQHLGTIIRQAKQASELIQQILDFSRRSVLAKQPLDLFSLIQKEAALLQRTLPEHIDIKVVGQPGTYIIQADPTRMQQTIMNLAINARDAMPDGGQFRFDLAPIEVKNSKQAPYPGMTAGNWIRLMITDSGSGIEAAVLEHVFEPFFTTKEPGKGTGLGLAQVHGIIGQHGGYITIDSQVSVGTAFTIYLPALNTSVLLAIDEDVDHWPHGNGELLLVVEDKAALREALVESLTMCQYVVLEAANGEEALAHLTEKGEAIKLIISDVIMPKMGGMALLQAVRQRGWTMPLILMSGHPLDEELPNLWAQGVPLILTKPVSSFQLAQVVASIFDPT
jgi:PAS domain S-box-containing protein